MKFAQIFLFVVLFVALAAAHQPRIVMDQRSSLQQPFIVDQPEISKAYYGELNGAPAYYSITSDKPFTLYLGLLTPDGSNEVFSALATAENNITVLQLKSDGSWDYYYEDFGGDSYRKGPEGRVLLEPGTYHVQISNDKEQGKYVLAVGEQESFPPLEAVSSLWSVFILKEMFFGKPVFLNFLQLLGIALAIGALSFADINSLITKGAERYGIASRYARNPYLWAGILLSVVSWLLIFMKNPVLLLGWVKSLLLLLLVVNSALLFFYLRPKVDAEGRSKEIPGKQMHVDVAVRILAAQLGWLLVLFLTAALI